jgi:hypothetical protein
MFILMALIGLGLHSVASRRVGLSNITSITVITTSIKTKAKIANASENNRVAVTINSPAIILRMAAVLSPMTPMQDMRSRLGIGVSLINTFHACAAKGYVVIFLNLSVDLRKKRGTVARINIATAEPQYPPLVHGLGLHPLCLPAPLPALPRVHSPLHHAILPPDETEQSDEWLLLMEKMLHQDQALSPVDESRISAIVTVQ